MNSKKNTNIFTIDDNIVFSLALKGYIETAFESMQVKVYSFDTGENCIEKFIHVKPELVILDFSLNSMSPGAANGLEVLDMMKKIYSETSVIMLTSNIQLDIALKSFHHGASDYVVKTEKQFEKIHSSIAKIFANKELAFLKKEKGKERLALLIAAKERAFQSEEREKWKTEVNFVNNELAFQTCEREKRAAELIIINSKLSFQNKTGEKRETELNLAKIQKVEAEKVRFKIEQKNKDITDSINYAKRLQDAKLPNKDKIYASLPNSFVLYKPKDIVSGDFYFFHLPPAPYTLPPLLSFPIAEKDGGGSEGTDKQGKDIFLIAAADCTGHGIPGAFMSIIAMEKLDAAVTHSLETSEILNHVNRGIKNSLHQSNSKDSTRDGMDIALCSVDKKNSVVKYAGANRPLWLIRKGTKKLEEIKGTKNAIGGLTDKNQHFESHELKLSQGDTFYLFTDGYTDQFGGKAGKKLMTRKFKKILIEIQDKSMLEQKIYLDNYIENWKNGIEQLDDILVIGVRL